MYITLSQEGMNPITISTESGYRSQEDNASKYAKEIERGSKKSVLAKPDEIVNHDKDFDEHDTDGKDSVSARAWAVTNTFKDIVSDPIKTQNELDSIHNEKAGRTFSDAYRWGAPKDDNGQPKSIAGMPSNLRAGTANGSYIPKTYVYGPTQIPYEVSPFTEDPVFDITGNNNNYMMAKMKNPEFMTDDEVEYYLNLMNKNEADEKASWGSEDLTRMKYYKNYKARLQAEYNKRNGIENPTTKNKISDIASNVTKVATNPENLKKAGIGAAILVTADVLVRRIIGGTVFNAATSIGKFNSGNEMLSSQKLKSKLSEIAKKYPGPYPTLERIKSDPKAKSRDTFIAWLLSGQSSNKKISDQIGSTAMLLKKSDNGIPVAITSLSVAGSQSVQQLSGLKILIANAFVNKNGQLASIPVCRGFLTKGSMVNASRECVDVFYGTGNLVLTKNQLMKRAKSVESLSLSDKIKYIDMTTI